jgi:chemotaxis protein MotB
VPYTAAAAYTNWELSGDRANAARRLLEAAGVAPRRIKEVRAMGPSRLRNADDPLAAENRRIALILPFSDLAQMTGQARGARPATPGQPIGD